MSISLLKASVFFTKILLFASDIPSAARVYSALFILVGFTFPMDAGTIIMLIFLALIFSGCVFLVISGAKAKKRIVRFKRYVSIISNESVATLDGLASATSQSAEFVTNDLQTMINKKFFANAHIDLRTGKIVIGTHVPPSVPENSKANDVANKKEKQNVSPELEHIKCPGCGAANSKAKGSAVTCDYCGTLIK